MNRNPSDIWGKTRPRSIACVGEAMIELAFATPGANTAKISVAGDVLNTAVYLRRNWSGHVAFVTATGTDAMSQRLVKFMNAESLDTEFVQRTDQASIGLYAISTDSKGERSFAYWRQNSAARRLFQTDIGPAFSALAKFDAVYLSAITLAILTNDVRLKLMQWLARYRREKNGLVVFDSNHRASLWENNETEQKIIDKMWQITDIGLPTEEDERAIFGDSDRGRTLQRLRQSGLRTGALKCGADGPVPIEIYQDTNVYLSVPFVTDTTAAGDSFNGAFLGAWASGGSFANALKSGHEQAGTVLRHSGAFAD